MQHQLSAARRGSAAARARRAAPGQAIAPQQQVVRATMGTAPPRPGDGAAPTAHSAAPRRAACEQQQDRHHHRGRSEERVPEAIEQNSQAFRRCSSSRATHQTLSSRHRRPARRDSTGARLEAPRRRERLEPGHGLELGPRRGVGDVRRDDDIVHADSAHVRRRRASRFYGSGADRASAGHGEDTRCRFESTPARPSRRLEGHMQVREDGQHPNRFIEQCPCFLRSTSATMSELAPPPCLLPRPSSARSVPPARPRAVIVRESDGTAVSPPALGRAPAAPAGAHSALADETEATRRILLRPDSVYDDALVRRPRTRPRPTWPCCAANGIAVRRRRRSRRCRRRVACSPQEERRRAVGRSKRATLAVAYNEALRKREPPVLMPLSEQRCRPWSARLRRLVQGRHRPGHQVRLAAAGARRHPLVRHRRDQAEPGDLARPAAGPGRLLAVLDRPLRAGPGLRLDHDLPRHRRRQAGAGDPALVGDRQRLRPRHRPDPSAVLVVGLAGRPARGRLALAQPGLCCRSSSAATCCSGSRRECSSPASARDARLAAVRQLLPADHRAPESPSCCCSPPGAGRPAGAGLRRVAIWTAVSLCPCLALLQQHSAPRRGKLGYVARDADMTALAALLDSPRAGAGRYRRPGRRTGRTSSARRARPSTPRIFLPLALHDNTLDGIPRDYILARPARIAWPGTHKHARRRLLPPNIGSLRHHQQHRPCAPRVRINDAGPVSAPQSRRRASTATLLGPTTSPTP